MKNFKRILSVTFILILSALWGQAHVDHYPSIHNTVTDIRKRLVEQYPHERLLDLTQEHLLEFMTDLERNTLAYGHIRFTVKVPVTVYILRTPQLPEGDPFWLEYRDFEKLDEFIQVNNERWSVWRKEFDADRLGFGVPSLAGDEDHYLIAVKPQDPSDTLTLQEMYPGQCRHMSMEQASDYFQENFNVTLEIPSVLQNTEVVMGRSEWEDYGQILDFFHTTRFPAQEKPDQIVLTWSEDPRTTQTIQWRTSTKINQGKVAYIKKSDYNRFSPKEPNYVHAQTMELETLDIVNDPVCHRHTAVLRDLEPDTTYLYCVGDGTEEGWSEFAEFTTAPDRDEPFSFIYMGDAQNGLDRWGSLVNNAFRERPDAEFYVMAGDLVNRGNERYDWDDFFYNAEGIYDRRQLVPAIGNHEDQGPGPWLYLKMFDLPKNGPITIEPERAYSFEYSNALFVILDSNLEPAKQTDWLEEQLKNSDATWKFVVYHHPAYSSAPRRDNQKIRKEWTPLFDKYHVDMALQGHDHAYLRTHPMNNNEPQEDPSEGTIYIVSVSGVKMYDQSDRDYTAFGMTNVSTYQTLDIQVVGDRLLYRSYDIDDNLRDEIEIVKSTW